MNIALIAGIVVLLIIILLGVRILMEYQRAVVFRLGRYNRVIGPGLVFLIPLLESARTVDLRIKTADIPKQEVMTKDNIQLLANTVVYFKVEKPEDAIIKIEDFEYAVQQYTQAALRDVVGNAELDFVLTEREKVATSIKKIVDAETADWGVDIVAIKIQEIELPQEMKRAMAKQAEAEREKRAVIISAEGELKASRDLQRAAANLSRNPAAIQLRTLQTMRDISTNPSQKIVIFMPSDMGNIVKKILK